MTKHSGLVSPSRSAIGAPRRYNGAMALQQLLGSLTTAAFFEDNFLKLPLARPGGCGHLAHLGGWEAIGHILAGRAADVLVGREGRKADVPTPTSADEARALLAQGLTVGIRQAHRHHAGLAELAASFHEDFAAPIDVHVYCTPAGQPGLGWHYDAEDVFILQTLGPKEWQLRKNTVNPWPLVETLPADMRYQREIMPVLRCTLAAGDWLYVPGGYWHSTRAVEESISLSVGVLSATAMDAFDFLRGRLLSSLRWRQRLPPAGAASPLSAEELVRHYQEVFTELGHDLATLLSQEELAREFLEAKRRNGPVQ
jgi:ribosomal protein L16 Arg81 hydroxylase